MVDFLCPICEERVPDVMCEPDSTRRCPGCGATMTEDWLPRTRRPHAQWSDRDTVVVFRNHATGQIEYPMRNDAPTKPGRERIELRSLRELEKFERDNKVRSEVAWYDSGSGTRRPDDTFRGERFTH